MAPRSRSETLLVTTVQAGQRSRHPDELIVEEPLTVQLDGTTVSTTMRTPGHDYELAVGFCHTEGLLAGHPVVGVRYCTNGSAVSSEFNVVTVETGGRAPAPRPRRGRHTGRRLPPPPGAVRREPWLEPAAARALHDHPAG